MVTVAITPDNDVIQAQIFIAAPPERVFQAITDPKEQPKWWGQKGLYRGTKCEFDLRPGGKWRSEGISMKGEPYQVEGEYLEVAPPHRLVYTWMASWTGELKTTVRWELEARGQGTQVTLRHSGFGSLPEAARDHGQGWTRVLGWMQAYLERGETVDSRAPSSAA